MIETYATATDFRKHLAQIANCVGYRQDRCVIMRHGQEIAALVSYEDLEFLRKHRPRKLGPPSIDVFSPKAAWQDHNPEPPPRGAPVEPPPGQEIVTLRDPFEMPLEEVKAYYCEFEPRSHESGELLDWLGRAALWLAANRVSLRSPSSPRSSD